MKKELKTKVVFLDGSFIIGKNPHNKGPHIVAGELIVIEVSPGMEELIGKNTFLPFFGSMKYWFDLPEAK